MSKHNDNIYVNNVWAIDDKFMSFTDAFSDVSIKTIIQKIQEENNKTAFSREPDITLLYSNKNNSGYRDVVICELKAFGTNSHIKAVAIPEINSNLGIVAKEIDNINNIWVIL